MLAINQLQQEAGDDRRITVDADILTPSNATTPTASPGLVGVWNSWSPDLTATKISITRNNTKGSTAWATTQENTKARINIDTDDTLRISQDDRMQAPSRPNLSMSQLFTHPSNTSDWTQRSAKISSLPQSALDPALGTTMEKAQRASKEYTTHSQSLLTNVVKGGMKWDLNSGSSYAKFKTDHFPNPENIPNPNTGTNTPGWLTQADVLHGLAPFISARSDSFVIRSMGEARNASDQVIATAMLEAVVQRTPEWVDSSDDIATEVTALKAEVNKAFGRRFRIVSVRELRLDKDGNPV